MANRESGKPSDFDENTPKELQMRKKEASEEYAMITRGGK